MISSTFKDSDGFQLQFEENCTEPDKKFYMKEFPRVDLIAQRKPHCTTCAIHIGTSPISEKVVRTHSILGVSQCVKCFAFYVSSVAMYSTSSSRDSISNSLSCSHISELWRIWKRRRWQRVLLQVVRSRRRSVLLRDMSVCVLHQMHQGQHGRKVREANRAKRRLVVLHL